MQSTLRKTLPELAAGDIAAAELFVADLLTMHRATFGDARMDDGDDDAQDDDTDEDDSEDDDKGSKGSDDDAQDDESEDDDKLREPGKKALERMKADRKTDRQLIRDQRAEIQQLKAAAAKKPAKKTGDDTEDKPDADEIRKQARAEADAEILQTRVLDKIEARTDGRFNVDPEDVAALVMRRNKTEDFLDSDGGIDLDEIDEALAQLLKDKPGLASGKDGKRFKGGSDSGRRKDTKPKAKSLTEALESRLNK